jgi:uncharacterized protein (TIGR02271 family)
MTTMTVDELMTLRGSDVYSNDGDKIGSLEQVYVDNYTGEPEWVAVKTGLFGTSVNLVPLEGARYGDGQSLQVAHSKDVVKDAPNVDPDGELSPQEEGELYRHYGLNYGSPTTQRDTTTGEGMLGRDRDAMAGEGTIARDTSGPETDSAMTVSEEQLQVDKTRNEAAGGRVRLRKYVVTDHETVSVPVEREVARIEREPITDANRDAAYDGPALSEEEAEITLSEEEVQVSKRTVPKERIRLEKDVVTEERSVTEDVSREEVEVDGDIDTPPRR